MTLGLFRKSGHCICLGETLGLFRTVGHCICTMVHYSYLGQTLELTAATDGEKDSYNIEIFYICKLNDYIQDV